MCVTKNKKQLAEYALLYSENTESYYYTYIIIILIIPPYFDNSTSCLAGKQKNADL